MAERVKEPPRRVGSTDRRIGSAGEAGEERGALAGRLGLSVPHEWWPSAPLLKSYEAAGFAWVQLHSPPASVLRDARLARGHAEALAASLATTGLRSVIHAPGSLRLGDGEADRAFAALLSYAAEVAAEQVVLHVLNWPEAPGSAALAARETESLRRLAPLAERLGVTVALENLAPLYPGREVLAASPAIVRDLVRRVGSERVAMCLDLGHAHIVADGRHTGVEHLCEPAADVVSLFHVHDNLGAKRRAARPALGVDPLRLDLHLAPGRGTLPWPQVATLLREHDAPLVLEVHPPHRPRAGELAHATGRCLGRPAAVRASG